MLYAYSYALIAARFSWTFICEWDMAKGCITIE